MYATLHKDRPISIEAAKLLGVPYSWEGCPVAYKFVPTEDGLQTHARNMTVKDDKWDQILDWRYMAVDRDFFVVTFHDEQEASDAPSSEETVDCSLRQTNKR